MIKDSNSGLGQVITEFPIAVILLTERITRYSRTLLSI